MKKIMMAALILSSMVSATTAQQLNPGVIENNNMLVSNTVRLDPKPVSENDKAYYLKKSRNNRIASWCLMGGGAVILGIGALTFPKDYDILFENSSETESKADVATTVIVVGAAAMLSSIPFTVMAGVNKRKAKIAIDSKPAGYGVPPGVSNSITSLTLTIGIGK